MAPDTERKVNETWFYYAKIAAKIFFGIAPCKLLKMLNLMRVVGPDAAPFERGLKQSANRLEISFGPDAAPFERGLKPRPPSASRTGRGPDAAPFERGLKPAAASIRAPKWSGRSPV